VPQLEAEFFVLAKTPPTFEAISSSQIVRNIRAPIEAPLRVDFAGGWLDVPKYSIPGEFIVNCAISPMVTLQQWDYKQKSGLGGSGAWALLNGECGVDKELEMGVGWQDPAVIMETGICVWKSGEMPRLDFKRQGKMLEGKMALYWTGQCHDTPGYVGLDRNYDLIEKAGALAREAILSEDINVLAEAVSLSYKAQLEEGMDELPEVQNAIAQKYSGGGHGGYALYLFLSTEARDEALSQHSAMRIIEPFLK